MDVNVKIMTPEKILKDAFDYINNRISSVFFNSNREYSCALGLLPKDNQNIYSCDNSEKYKHYLFITKRYRDKGCAIYKLIRFLESSTKDATEIYWRLRPNIVRYDFPNSLYPIFIGRVRFTSL